MHLTTKEAKHLIQIAGGDTWTTSLIIAEEFGRQHKNVLQSIDGLIKDGTIDRLDFEPISYTDEMNRDQRAYKLNERAALTAMPFIGGKKSREGQKRLVDAFLAMRQIIKQQDAHLFNFEWKQARENGKVARISFTDNVQEFVGYAKAQGSQNAEKYYMQLTKMENKALFIVGKAVGENFRDRLNIPQLTNLGTAELVAQRALREGMESGLHYKAVYQLAKQRVEAIANMIGKSLPGEQMPRLRYAA